MNILKPTKSFIKRLLHGETEDIIRAGNFKKQIRDMYNRYFEECEDESIEAAMLYNGLRVSFDEDRMLKIEFMADDEALMEAEIYISELTNTITFNLEEGLAKMIIP